MTKMTMMIQFSNVRHGYIDVVLASVRVVLKLLVSLVTPFIAITVCCIVTPRACAKGIEIGLCGFVCRPRPASPQKLPVWEI